MAHVIPPYKVYKEIDAGRREWRLFHPETGNLLVYSVSNADALNEPIAVTVGDNDENWDISKHGLDIEISGFQLDGTMLDGMGDGDYVLVCQWLCAKASRRGSIILKENITSSELRMNGIPDVKFKIPPIGRGELTLKLVISKTELCDGQPKPGFLRGILATLSLKLDGDVTTFPVVYDDLEDGLLWEMYMSDFTSANLDDELGDHCLLRINRKHPDKILMTKDDSTLSIEVYSSAFLQMLVIAESRLGSSFEDDLKRDFRPNSLGNTLVAMMNNWLSDQDFCLSPSNDSWEIFTRIRESLRKKRGNT